MINKQGVIFLTLTSLALALSIYYITMPSDLLVDSNKDSIVVSVDDSNIVTSMRVDLDNERNEEVSEIKSKLSDSKLSVDEKNSLYEELKYLTNINSKEENLEKKILDEFKLTSFIKIDGDNVNITIISSEHSKELVLSIMKSIESEFDTDKYITINFKE